MDANKASWSSKYYSKYIEITHRVNWFNIKKNKKNKLN